MQKVLEALKIAEGLLGEEKRIIGLQLTSRNERFEAQVSSGNFKEIVEEANIQPCYVEVGDREDTDYPKELWVEISGVVVLCVLTEHEYEMEFRDWIYDEPNIDEKFIVEETSPLPENVRLMKEAGMSHKDFE